MGCSYEGLFVRAVGVVRLRPFPFGGILLDEFQHGSARGAAHVVTGLAVAAVVVASVRVARLPEDAPFAFAPDLPDLAILLLGQLLALGLGVGDGDGLVANVLHLVPGQVRQAVDLAGPVLGRRRPSLRPRAFQWSAARVRFSSGVDRLPEFSLYTAAGVKCPVGSSSSESIYDRRPDTEKCLRHTAMYEGRRAGTHRR